MDDYDKVHHQNILSDARDGDSSSTPRKDLTAFSDKQKILLTKEERQRREDMLFILRTIGRLNGSIQDHFTNIQAGIDQFYELSSDILDKIADIDEYITGLNAEHLSLREGEPPQHLVDMIKRFEMRTGQSLAGEDPAVIKSALMAQMSYEEDILIPSMREQQNELSTHYDRVIADARGFERSLNDLKSDYGRIRNDTDSLEKIDALENIEHAAEDLQTEATHRLDRLRNEVDRICDNVDQMHDRSYLVQGDVSKATNKDTSSAPTPEFTSFLSPSP